MTDERGSTDSYTTTDGIRIHSRKSEPPRTDYNRENTADEFIEHINKQNKLRTLEQFELDVWSILEEAGTLLLSKHADYGPTNISRSPGGPINGLRVRIHDKTARINNLIDNSKDPKHESLRDSFIDLLNYSAIALLVLDGKWPND